MNDRTEVKIREKAETAPYCSPSKQVQFLQTEEQSKTGFIPDLYLFIAEMCKAVL